MDTIIPIPTRSIADILYGGSRQTTYRYEVLTHDTATGVDLLLGFLDGVQSASLQWNWNATVKGSGTMKVTDIAEAAPGYVKVAGINLVTARIRPVLVVEGLPEIPLGIYIITAAPEEWADTGRVYNLQLHDKSSVLGQDSTETVFTADGSKTILGWVQTVIESAGETLTVNSTQNRTLANPMTWAAGTSKLSIVNDLLDVLLYNALTIDGVGNFIVSPYLRPALRPIRYEVLDIPRELIDGPTSVYIPQWSRDKDSYGVPNRVVAVSTAGGDAPPLTGTATNQDPDSPYSYQKRGRWITHTLTGVDVPDGTDTAKVESLQAKARQSLIAASSPQATVQLKCVPVPIRIGDAIRFKNTPAGIDARHIVQALQLDCTPKGLMSPTLQEVIDL